MLDCEVRNYPRKEILDVKQSQKPVDVVSYWSYTGFWLSGDRGINLFSNERFRLLILPT